MARKKGQAGKIPAESIPAELKGVLDPGQQQAALTLAYLGYYPGTNRQNGAVAAAARRANVTPKQVYNWLKEEYFLTALDTVQNEIIIELVENIRSIARSKNLTASIYLLKILNHERFDDQFLRQKAEREHELQVLKQRMAGLEEQVQQLPSIVFTETPARDTENDPEWTN